MATVELTGQNFESVVGGADMVLVDFWASWCGPCRMFAPVFDRASEKHSDAVFGKVDTDAETELAQQFSISSIPTLMVIRDNIVLYAQPGALPEQALEELITKARELDMDEVRASIAQDQSEHDHEHEHDTSTSTSTRTRSRRANSAAANEPAAIHGGGLACVPARFVPGRGLWSQPPGRAAGAQASSCTAGQSSIRAPITATRNASPCAGSAGSWPVSSLTRASR